VELKFRLVSDRQLSVEMRFSKGIFVVITVLCLVTVEGEKRKENLVDYDAGVERQPCSLKEIVSIIFSLEFYNILLSLI
jgi:hypothetical protein